MTRKLTFKMGLLRVVVAAKYLRILVIFFFWQFSKELLQLDGFNKSIGLREVRSGRATSYIRYGVCETNSNFTC